MHPGHAGGGGYWHPNPEAFGQVLKLLRKSSEPAEVAADQ